MRKTTHPHPLRRRLFALLGALALLPIACDGSDGSNGDGDGGGDDAEPDALTEAEPDAVAEPDAAPEEELAAEVETIPTGCDPEPEAGTFWALSGPDRDTGEDVRMCNYRGRLVLVVNTAASWGFTPQLGELANLQTEFEGEGLTVLGFYCNQFAGQGGTVEQQQECEATYGVTFPVFGLVNVNPPDEHPIFTWLKSQPLGTGQVQWNFTKWLVSRTGEVLGRWETNVTPFSLGPIIEGEL